MSRGALRTLLTMFSLLIISSTLIYFGSRGDATTIAKSIKSGVLTADTVDVSFENVGGVLLKRDIEESQIVKKGDVLMVLMTPIQLSVLKGPKLPLKLKRL